MHRSTPRYTGVVMPATVVPGATAITPLRGATPPRPIPAQHAEPRSRQQLILHGVPVQSRPWKVLLVPPTPGARTRTFALARWQARVALGGLVTVLLLAASAITAVIVALESPEVMPSSVEVASLRDRLSALEDSLVLARAVLADGAIATSESASPSTVTPGADAVRSPLMNRIIDRSASRTVRATGAVSTRAEALPVIGAIVSGFTRARRHPLLHVVRPHLGIDIAAARGTRVSAPASGRITYIGRNFALGLTMEIAHAEGVSTRYAHLRSALVHVGDEVARGATIATVGSSGLTTGPHLHYEVAVNGRPVDPTRFRLPQVGGAVGAPLPIAGSGAVKDDPTTQHP